MCLGANGAIYAARRELEEARHGRGQACGTGRVRVDVGRDAEAFAPRRFETVTLEVARRLRTLVEMRLGIRVILTRDEDRAITLDERAAIANNSKADLFLSLHLNAAPVAAVATVAAVSLLTTFGSAAFAQAGHFVGTPTCRDIGTQVQCTGKVAGLGGTTFTILVSAPGTATVTCTNPAGKVAPGQTFDTTATGQSGPFPTPRNGQARSTVSTETPAAPPGSCPNPQWTATVTDVTFGPATVTLLEDSTISDVIPVPVT